jgi:hypothetical protein
MYENAETFEHAGLTVAIWTEEYVDDIFNPRQDDGRLGVMFCDHRDYILGDKNAPDPRGQTVECDRCEGMGEDPDGRHIVIRIRPYAHEIVKVDFTTRERAEAYIEAHQPEGETWEPEPQSCPVCKGEGELEIGIVEYLQREHGARVILPLFLYDHSGISMSVGSRMKAPADERKLDPRGHNPFDTAAWDTSSVGVIFDTAETRKVCGCEDWSDDRIEKSLRLEVEVYDEYLRGNIFGYSVIAAVEDDEGVLRDVETGEETDLRSAETLDSCGGMIDTEIHRPDESYVYAEARSAAEYCAQQIRDEQREADEWRARDVETVTA